MSNICVKEWGVISPMRTVILLLAAWMLPQSICNAAPTEDLLKGFVIADAHLGWDNPQQPSPAEQSDVLRHVLGRFPDLDVLIDTGDAHHGNASFADMGAWTDVVVSGAGRVPFFYVPGNHEIDAFGRPYDIEWRAQAMGSLPCRPYHSFDLQGVHFVALPQMMMMSYVSREALEWVELDLALNGDKTVIFLAHNSLEGTTQHHDDVGYRRIANSEALFDLFRRYPNVIAWMHGHNHSYEVVPWGGVVYVSNGRFGGFNPPGGAYGWEQLGGIYFEVGPRHFTVRAYSATDRCFFDELPGFSHLSWTVEKETSFDPGAVPAVSFGYGGARDGQRIPFFSHHVAGSTELFLTGCESPVINENADLSVYTQRTCPGWRTKHLPGFALEPREDNAEREDKTWEWLDPGVRILARDDAGAEKSLVCPGGGLGQRSYFRCPPGADYEVSAELDAHAGGQTMQWRCEVYDRRMRRLALLEGQPRLLEPGRQGSRHVFSAANLGEEATIYTDGDSDNALQIQVSARFTGITDPVDIYGFELTFAGAEGGTRDIGLVVNSRTYARAGELRNGDHTRFVLDHPLSARNVCQVSAGGNRRLTWLIRQSALAWQVRNAPVSARDGYLEVGPMRNTCSQHEEVVIAPMGAGDPGAFVHKLRHVAGAVIAPEDMDAGISLEVLGVTGPAEVEIAAAEPPSSVAGADGWRFEDGRLVLTVGGPRTIEVHF